VTKFASHKVFKSIAWGKLTFDERCVVHRVVGAQTSGLVESRTVEGDAKVVRGARPVLLVSGDKIN